MNYLAIDTSGKNLTIVICKDDEIFSYFDSECGVSHSISLMVELEKLIKKADFDLNRADFFAVCVGAGSFTGIRIGVATVKALCFSYNKKFLAVTSFDTIAYNMTSGKNLAVIDANHNGYYVCGYDGLKEILPPSYVTGETLKELQEEYTLLSFSKLKNFDSKIVDIEKGLISAILNKKQDACSDLDVLTPLYVRKSQAEEGRK